MGRPIVLDGTTDPNLPTTGDALGGILTRRRQRGQDDRAERLVQSKERDQKREAFAKAIEVAQQLSPNARVAAFDRLLRNASSDPDLADLVPVTQEMLDAPDSTAAQDLASQPQPLKVQRAKLAESAASQLSPEKLQSVGETLLRGTAGPSMGGVLTNLSRIPLEARRRAENEVLKSRAALTMKPDELVAHIEERSKAIGQDLLRETMGILQGTGISEEVDASLGTDSLFGTSIQGTPPFAPEDEQPTIRGRGRGTPPKDSPLARQLEESDGTSDRQRGGAGTTPNARETEGQFVQRLSKQGIDAETIASLVRQHYNDDVTAQEINEFLGR